MFSACKRAKFIYKDVLNIAIILIISELLLTFLAPSYKHHLFDDEYTGSYPIDLNSSGYRGPVIPFSRSKNESLRILAFGDSITFGTGVPVDSIWPKQLERKLSQGTDMLIEVVPLGFPGAGLRAFTKSYETEWYKYKPDSIIILVSSLMLSRNYVEENNFVSLHEKKINTNKLGNFHNAKKYINRFIRKFSLPTFISQNWQAFLYIYGLGGHDVNPNYPLGFHLAYGWKQADLPDKIISDAWKLFEDDLQALKMITDEHGINLIVGFAPPRFVLSESFLDNVKRIPKDRIRINPNDKLESILQENSIGFVNIQDFFLTSAPQEDLWGLSHYGYLYIPFDYGHFSSIGHDLIAKAFYESLQKTQNLSIQVESVTPITD